MTALLPCPFCGGEAKEVRHDDGQYRYFVVQCAECKAAQGWEENAATAIAAWNRRASAPQPADPITTTLAAELHARAAMGLHKYGVTVTDSPLSRRQWLEHAKQEALDLAVYLQRLIEMEAQ